MRGGSYGDDNGSGNLDAHIGLDPSVTATFQSGTTTWFSYVGAFAWDRNQGSPTFMIGTDPTVNGGRGMTMDNQGSGIGGTGGPTRFNLQHVTRTTSKMASTTRLQAATTRILIPAFRNWATTTESLPPGAALAPVPASWDLTTA